MGGLSIQIVTYWKQRNGMPPWMDKKKKKE
jgi:hypothetical protein